VNRDEHGLTFYHQYTSGVLMRMSVSLEPDIEPIVRSFAKDRDTSLNRAINELIRRGVQPRQSELVVAEDGLPIVKGARPLTTADVDRIEAENA